MLKEDVQTRRPPIGLHFRQANPHAGLPFKKISPKNVYPLLH